MNLPRIEEPSLVVRRRFADRRAKRLAKSRAGLPSIQRRVVGDPYDGRVASERTHKRERALAAVEEVAHRLGLNPTGVVVIAESNNTVVRLPLEELVAKVSTSVFEGRGGARSNGRFGSDGDSPIAGCRSPLQRMTGWPGRIGNPAAPSRSGGTWPRADRRTMVIVCSARGCEASMPHLRTSPMSCLGSPTRSTSRTDCSKTRRRHPLSRWPTATSLDALMLVCSVLCTRSTTGRRFTASRMTATSCGLPLARS